MSISGTDAYAATDPTTLPPLVQRAVIAARHHGFAHSCRPEQGRLLHALAGSAPPRVGDELAVQVAGVNVVRRRVSLALV